jgi:hypothetical protein
MGYNPPTNDPVAALRRAQAEKARSEREALSMGGTQPFQAVRKLQAQINDLIELTSFLSGQQGVDTRAYGDVAWIVMKRGTFDDTWEPYNSAYDPSVTFTAPSSGLVRVDLSGYLQCGVNAVSDSAVSVQGTTLAAVELLHGTSQQLAPSRGHSIRMRAEAFGANNAVVNGATLSMFYRLSGLTPGDEYTARVRRGSWGSFGDGALDASWQNFQTNSLGIGVVKVGL